MTRHASRSRYLAWTMHGSVWGPYRRLRWYERLHRAIAQLVGV